jgi:hypothetical protein
VLLGERKAVNLSSNQVNNTYTNGNNNVNYNKNNNNNNNVNLLDDIMSGSTNSSKEETFSGLEIRNKPTNNNNSNNTTNGKPSNNGFVFIKGKNNEDNVTNNVANSNKELLNIFGNNEIINGMKNVTAKNENGNKGGFVFIKSGKTSTNNTQKDDLLNVFENLNIVSKGEEKSSKQNENVSKTLQETYNNKLDLDKLYSETNNHNNNNQFMQYNNNNNNNNNNINNNGNHYPQQFPQNNNNNIHMGVPSQNKISYNQNFNLNVADFTNNLKIGENYIPLDIKDYNKQPEKTPTPEAKNEKHHFDFVNDMFKKKK